MKKNSRFLIVLLLLHFISFAQENKAKIIYSIKNEKSFFYKEKVIDGDTLIGYVPRYKIFFKRESNFKLYLLDDKIFLNSHLLYCFKNVQYYEALLFLKYNNKEYLYIYPHYYGRVGPYIWSELGVLIEIKSLPLIKENMDYFEDYEVDRLLKFKKFKIKKSKNKTCIDGSND